ncbi:MAG: SDR family NAD(P)-dependent oxidoreductase [Micavibrio sp.]|nr:MAG: SDR family NAD(P)-dependent oxidoreductase [Micavibrio sp.]
MEIKNQIILITGANRGIGHAYAEEFLKADARKIYLGVRDPETVREFAEKHKDRVEILRLDLTSPADIRAAAEKAKDVTVLVSNAGVLEAGDLLDKQVIERSRREMEINYFGPLALLREFAPVLRGNGGGAFVGVSSIAGLLPFPGLASYTCSKAAMHFLIMQARTELALQNTKVFGVYPGPVDTEMARDIHMPKAAPRDVALETIRGLREGHEDILPDQYARESYELFRKDPKELERKLRRDYLEMMKAA